MKKLKVELTENNIRRVVTYVDDPVNPDKRISLDSVEYYETEKEYLPEDDVTVTNVNFKAYFPFYRNEPIICKIRKRNTGKSYDEYDTVEVSTKDELKELMKEKSNLNDLWNGFQLMLDSNEEKLNKSSKKKLIENESIIKKLKEENKLLKNLLS